jgi:hypothetical protein
MITEELAPASVSVWIHSACPESKLEQVARTVLSRELFALAKRAEHGALSEREIHGLFDDVPETTEFLREESTSSRHSLVRAVRPAPLNVTRYILEDQRPQPCNDVDLWRNWMGTFQRWVGDTELTGSAGAAVRICTVFLGLDVSFGGATPILFETMILGGQYDRELYRYYTWADAQTGHSAIVAAMADDNGSMLSGPVIRRARELALQTVKVSAQSAVRLVIERTAKGLGA